MLKSRNLDNQTFDEIMDFILGRLPWVCPDWTDHNAHDPGITILELIAWYKEMQQYHLNTVTESMRRKLLRLVGITPEPAKAARCFIEMPPGSGEKRRLTRLETAEDVPFELLDSIDGGAEIGAVYTEWGGEVTDVTDIIRQPNISFMPFAYAGKETTLCIGFENVRHSHIRIWFDIDDQHPVARNPFADMHQAPRVIEWTFVGDGIHEPERDDTHALSCSGYVELRVPEDDTWPKTKIGGKKMKYLRLRLIDPGCEENVRISSISARRHLVSQQETWASVHSFNVQQNAKAELVLTDALSCDGLIYAFLRTESGLRLLEFEAELSREGRTLSFDAAESAQDGDDNLLIVSADAMHIRDLIHPSTGLPDMRILLPLGDRRVLTDRSGLICDTLEPDGVVRPAIWRYVDDLRAYGPRDRVFTCDFDRESLVFGDGEHGCIVPAGDAAILVAPFVLSYCSEGNVPDGVMSFSDDGLKVSNTAAVHGAEAQSVDEASRLFLRRLENPQKCASESDYERGALMTPGLRVEAAKAVAGYDPDEPSGVSRIPVVTVIAVPYSNKIRPLPDNWFLESIRAHIESMRPICTKVKVIAPRYIPVGLFVQVRTDIHDAEEKLREAAENYLRLTKSRSIGDPVVRIDLMALLMKIDGVYKVERLELRQLGADCYITPGGDIIVPQNAVAYLAEIDVSIR